MIDRLVEVELLDKTGTRVLYNTFHRCRPILQADYGSILLVFEPPLPVITNAHVVRFTWQDQEIVVRDPAELTL